jgi:hypothetical protein
MSVSFSSNQDVIETLVALKWGLRPWLRQIRNPYRTGADFFGHGVLQWVAASRLGLRGQFNDRCALHDAGARCERLSQPTGTVDVTRRSDAPWCTHIQLLSNRTIGKTVAAIGTMTARAARRTLQGWTCSAAQIIRAKLDDYSAALHVMPTSWWWHWMGNLKVQYNKHYTGAGSRPSRHRHSG